MELESIWAMELLARFSFRKLVMLTKSLASMFWMWFSDRSLELKKEKGLGEELYLGGDLELLTVM